LQLVKREALTDLSGKGWPFAAGKNKKKQKCREASSSQSAEGAETY